MSECIEQHDFIKTYELSKIREQLAERDADCAESSTLYDVFLDGCPGWNNIDVETCIEEFTDHYLCPGEKIRFFVTDGSIFYEVIADVDDIKIIDKS